MMALHIFNCSVDAPDFRPDYIPEDLNYNDMESVAEIFLEKVLDINNAMSEHDENDGEDGYGGSTIKKAIDFSYCGDYYNCATRTVISTDVKHPIQHDSYFEQFHPELIPPPPKA